MKTAPNGETQKPGGAIGSQNSHENVPRKSTASARFLGTDNPRQLRAITVLLRRPVPREDLDGIAGCSNAPDLVAQLRALGLDVPCERISFTDRDNKPCRPGVYSLSTTDRRRVNAWLAKRAGG